MLPHLTAQISQVATRHSQPNTTSFYVSIHRFTLWAKAVKKKTY